MQLHFPLYHRATPNTYQYLGSRKTNLALEEWGSHNCSIDLVQGDGLSRAKSVHWKVLLPAAAWHYDSWTNYENYLPPALYWGTLHEFSHFFVLLVPAKRNWYLSCTHAACITHQPLSQMGCSKITQTCGVCQNLRLHSLWSVPNNKSLHPTHLCLLVYSYRNQLSIQILIQGVTRAVNVKCKTLNWSSAEVGYHCWYLLWPGLKVFYFGFAEAFKQQEIKGFCTGFCLIVYIIEILLMCGEISDS